MPSVCNIDFASPSISGDQFAFARMKGNVCLVRVSLSNPDSALSMVDVKIFRHEFITMFRYSHCDTVHPADIRILEPIDDALTRYEEENGIVFLAKNLMESLRKMTDKRASIQRSRPQPMQVSRDQF